MTGPETDAGAGEALLSITVSYLSDGGGEARTMLRAVGEVDLSTVEMLAEQLHRVLATGADVVVVDLEAVSFLSARGVSNLALAAESARVRGIQFQVRATQRRVVRVFELTGTADLVGLREPSSSRRAGPGGDGRV